jgi:hypothetical protein
MWLLTPPPYSVNPDPGNPSGIVSAERGRFLAPSDGEIGPDGAFYFLEYGGTYYAPASGRVSRIKCAGCLPSDVSKNYGIEVESAAVQSGLVPGGTSTPLSLLAIAGAVASLAIGVRRRRRLVV